jgi:hypothetical protein
VVASKPEAVTTPPAPVVALTSQLQLADSRRTTERSSARGGGFREVTAGGLHALVLFALGVAALLAYTLVASLTTGRRPAFAFVAARRPVARRWSGLPFRRAG